MLARCQASACARQCWQGLGTAGQRRAICAGPRAFSRQNADDDFNRRALAEAVATYTIATQLAEAQTRAELQESFQADFVRSGPAAGAEPDSTPPTEEALVAFWVEQGLRETQAARLVRELQQDPATAGLPLHALSSQLSTLRRVLPTADAAQLVQQQPQVLLRTAAQIVQTLVQLVEHLPGRDVGDMVARQPKLLFLEDLPRRAPQVIGKLQQLHPSGAKRVVEGIVHEHPDLLLRMPYYMDATLLDDLPLELQNMMVLADQGLGFLYRYYKRGGRDNNAAEDPGEELET